MERKEFLSGHVLVPGEEPAICAEIKAVPVLCGYGSPGERKYAEEPDGEPRAVHEITSGGTYH